MRTYAANGIVLRRIDLGEKDRILTIFSKEHGKLAAVAKGARRPGSRLSAASEPFTYCKMLLASGRNLDILSQADIRESFPCVKCDMNRVAYAAYVLELTYHFLENREPNPDLFDSLLSVMYVMESGADPQICARRFELDLLSLLGYEPRFDCCAACGGAPGPGRIGFSPSLGGITCGVCSGRLADAMDVSGSAPSWVTALRRADPRDIGSIRMPAGARRDIARMLRAHIRYRLEREIKSTDFIRLVESLESGRDAR